MEKQLKILSKIISVLFHPLLMPTYALLIIFNSGTHYYYIAFELKKLVYLLVIISTFVIPVSLIPFLINLKVVSDFSMQKGRERFFPLLVTTLSFFFAYQVLHSLSIVLISFIEMMLLASTILVFLCFLVSLKWKISAHLIGIGGLIAAIIYYAISYTVDLRTIIVSLILISGLVAFARLQLQAHSSAQVYTGFIAGFLGMLILLYIGF